MLKIIKNAHVLDLYRKAVEYNVEEPQVYARLAYALGKIRSRSKRETLRLMQIAVQKDPNNPDFRCRLGELCSPRIGAQCSQRI